MIWPFGKSIRPQFSRPPHIVNANLALLPEALLTGFVISALIWLRKPPGALPKRQTILLSDLAWAVMKHRAGRMFLSIVLIWCVKRNYI